MIDQIKKNKELQTISEENIDLFCDLIKKIIL